MKNMKLANVRLAFREEGTMWNCYLAKKETMKDAILLGSINMEIVQNHIFKEAFMKFMQLVLLT